MGENTVNIDDAQLTAEAAAVVLPEDPAAPVDPSAPSPIPGDPSPEQAMQVAKGYEPTVFLMVSQGADILLPNWQITHDEKRQLAEAASLALAFWFPDANVPPKWAALLGVVAVGYSITQSRVDPNSGELKPRKIVKIERPGSVTQQPQGVQPGGFATST